MRHALVANATHITLQKTMCSWKYAIVVEFVSVTVSINCPTYSGTAQG
jgi:hypothetical protein